MSPHVKDGQLVTISPYTSFFAIAVDDIVLCRVHGHQYLHFVKALVPMNRRVLIADARGRENGWTGADRVYGKLVAVAP